MLLACNVHAFKIQHKLKGLSMTRFLSGLIFISTLLLTGCDSSSEEDKLIGTWESSVFITSADAAKMSEDPLPEGASMEITISSSETFHIGGKYNGHGKFTIRAKQGSNEMPFNFMVKDAGTWKIHDGVLVQTSSDSLVTPLDEFTKKMVTQSPEIGAAFTPVSGESVSLKLNNMSDTTIEVEMMETPYISYIMKKKLR